MSSALSALRTSGIVYAVVAFALWLSCPPHPRCAIHPVHMNDGIEFVAFSPDSQWLLTMQRDRQTGLRGELGGAVQVWNVATGKHHAVELTGRRFDPMGFTSDSRRIYIDERLYDRETGRECPDGSEIARLASIGKDGMSLRLQAEEGSMLVIDDAKNEARFTIEGGTAASLRSDGKELAVAVDLGLNPLRWSVGLYDPQTGVKLRDVAQGEGYAGAVALSPGSDRIGVGVCNESKVEHTLEIWNVDSGQHERRYESDQDWLGIARTTTLEFLPSGRAVVLKSNVLAGLRVFDLSAPAGRTEQRLFRAVLERDGDRLAHWDEQAGAIVVRRLGHGQPDAISHRAYEDAATLRIGPTDSPWPVGFTKDGYLLVYVEEHPDLGSARWLSAWLPTPRVHGYYDVIDPETGRLVRKIAGPAGTCVVGMTPDMKTLATNDHFGIALWDVPLQSPWATILGWPLVPALAAGACGLYAGRRAKSGSLAREVEA